MSVNEYHFVTTWRVPGTVQEVAEVLADAEDLPRWWPAVYLDVRELKPGNEEDGIGKEVALFTKGWLPYTLRWNFRVTESNYPHGFAIEAWGDLAGRGEWSLRQDGEQVVVTYDWRIEAEKPILRRLAFLLKPLFAANHQWAMRRGEESLRLELARRAAPLHVRAMMPIPKGPTTLSSLLAPLGAAAALVLAGALLRRGKLAAEDLAADARPDGR